MDGFKGRVATVGGLLSALMVGAFVMSGASSATPADPVSDAFGDLQDKVTLYGGAVVALVVAAIIILFGVKWLKKGASKA